MEELRGKIEIGNPIKMEITRPQWGYFRLMLYMSKDMRMSKNELYSILALETHTVWSLMNELQHRLPTLDAFVLFLHFQILPQLIRVVRPVLIPLFCPIQTVFKRYSISVAQLAIPSLFYWQLQATISFLFLLTPHLCIMCYLSNLYLLQPHWHSIEWVLIMSICNLLLLVHFGPYNGS